MMEEIWKDIIGFEGSYQVSNLGRVRSLDRIVVNEKRWNQYRIGKILSLRNSKGYSAVALSGKNYRVHRLVAKAFIPNPENKPYINHINGIRNDNNINNLEWCTPKQNCIHAVQSGFVKKIKQEGKKYPIQN